jgi:hypothetical protein
MNDDHTSASVPSPDRDDGDPGEDRDIDAEFARLLEDEGLLPGDRAPGAAGGTPGEPPAPASTGMPPADTPSQPPEDDGRELLTGDEAVLGDFVPPDPDLPTASDATVWSWTVLVAGLVVLVLAATDVVPGWLGAIGAATAVGGLVALLIRVPRSHDHPDDGAQV